jgi:hypothetical protein
MYQEEEEAPPRGFPPGGRRGASLLAVAAGFPMLNRGGE